MKFKFGAPRENSSSDAEEEPRDPSKRRTLKQLGALALTADVAGSSKEAEKGARGVFAERFVAAEQLKKNGITDFQRQAYKPGLSEALARGVQPFGYSEKDSAIYDPASDTWNIAPKQDAIAEVRRIIDAFTKDATTDSGQIERLIRDQKKKNYLPDKEARTLVHSRMDAWRTYLGLPQTNGTFGISEFKPSNSKDDIYYYKINRFLEDYASNTGIEEENPQGFVDIRAMTTKEVLRWFVNRINEETKEYGKPVRLADRGLAIMGHYTLTKGRDDRGEYISYYDRWDLDGSFEGKGGVIGKPFEIYDRIYYDPKTFEVIPTNLAFPQGSLELLTESKN